MSLIGTHSAVYHAKPLDKEIVFTKVKQTKALENADQDHTKVYGLLASETKLRFHITGFFKNCVA